MKIDYAVFGSGNTPMVIIPGMSLHPVTPGAGMVEHEFSAFCGQCKIYLFDRRKHLEEGFSVMDMAEDTVEAMRLLGIRDAFVYGTSQGGMMAMCIAARHPELVSKLALASTLARQNDTCTNNMIKWEKLALAGDPVALNREVYSKVYSPSFYERHRKAFAVMEKQGTPEEMRNFAISARACRNFDIADELGLIRCPVFIAGVADDTVIGSEGVPYIASRLGCEALLYPGKGHAMYDEDKHFVERLYEFFCLEFDM